MALNVLGVIPVRMSSTRLPGKPLKDIAGKTLVERVWLQAQRSSLVSELVVATDSPEIVDECRRIGAECVLTSSDILTGTDRVAAVLHKRNFAVYDLAVNIQGDMPFIKGEIIDQLITELSLDGECGMGTIATPITQIEEFQRSSSVKVVVDTYSRALYFSRAQIPFPRDGFTDDDFEPYGLKHIGLYAFEPSTLQRIATFPQTLAEKREGLEQLRALTNGIKIKVAVIPRDIMEPAIEVDTPDDLDRANEVATEFDRG